MKQEKKYLLIALSILLGLGVVILLFYSTRNIKEAFESSTPDAKTLAKSKTPAVVDKPDNPSKEVLKLSSKEQTLLNDLLSNKLTDVNIQTLIQSGFLTESMIEKFLTQIQTNQSGETNVGALSPQASLALNTSVPKNDAAIKEKMKIEKFTGFETNMPIYAQY